MRESFNKRQIAITALLFCVLLGGTWLGARSGRTVQVFVDRPTNAPAMIPPGSNIPTNGWFAEVPIGKEERAQRAEDIEGIERAARQRQKIWEWLESITFTEEDYAWVIFRSVDGKTRRAPFSKENGEWR